MEDGSARTAAFILSAGVATSAAVILCCILHYGFGFSRMEIRYGAIGAAAAVGGALVAKAIEKSAK
jgi:hypothetical protein